MFYIMVIGMIFIFVGLSILFLGLRSYNKIKSSANWPNTQGKIEKSEVKYKPARWWQAVKVPVYSPQTTYCYVVKGIEYHSDRISIVGFDTADKDRAQDTVEKYPVGSSVSVRYDPQNPGFAFLEVGQSKSGLILLLLIGSVVLILGIIGFILIPRL
jgi:Na+-transporting methylmalonyl-CoA/oxaloacetate decarboxylase gamma subunit